MRSLSIGDALARALEGEENPDRYLESLRAIVLEPVRRDSPVLIPVLGRIAGDETEEPWNRDAAREVIEALSRPRGTRP